MATQAVKNGARSGQTRSATSPVLQMRSGCSASINFREFDRPLDRHQITDMHIADVGDAKPVPGRRPNRCGDIDVPDEHALGFVSGEQASAAEPIQPAGDEQMPQLGPSELG